MNEKVFKTLEYNKIILMLKEAAVSPMGKEICENLKPTNVLFDISAAQKETSDAQSMILQKGNISLGGLREIRPQLKRVSMGGVLCVEELLNIGEFLYVCRKVENYSKADNKNQVFETIQPYFDAIELLPHLEKEISRCIISETQIADDASNKLREIRKDIKVSNEKVKDHLNNIITSSTYRTMLQDPVITIRNDRYCVPVKSEYRSAFNGMVHDQSNTGSTLFIEPLSVVQLNNNIKELFAKEKEEIEKILKMLSEKVAENTDVLNSNLQMLAHLDFVFAKGNLSINMMATEPIFNNKGIIDIKKGRHPLLNKDTVVPINIYLGDKFTTLLITGPNTGGKTVAIKTLGLFTLMGQAGLHIPAFDKSELAVFDDVFADIGDEQSIEQSLSTFSSHMTNIVEILKNITDNSLVLFDELGAGTDPIEGAALAMAIIDKLHKRKIRTAVTTHYSELKVYAISTEGVENGSCEFNVETLRPTYRLLIGVPGRSNAFAISKRLGLSDDVIDSAKEFISHEEVKFEDVITDLEISKKTLGIEQERAEQYRKEAEMLKKDVEKQKEKTRLQREKIILEAREEARMIFQKAKEEADAIVKEVNKQAREKSNQAKLAETRAKLKERLNDMDSKVAEATKKRPNHKPIKDLKIGDRVYVISFDQNATAISLPDNNGEVMVQAGIMKIKVPLKELMIADNVEKAKPVSKYRNVKESKNKSQYISAEVDCRGMTVDEGIAVIDKYIDDAYLSGLKTITIIHGKGTGVLRAAVQRFLSKNPHVKFHRPGVFGEGEMGVTVVELK